MFKSAKYYFRKKSTEKKDPAKRRTYINVDKELINAMDNHINASILNVDKKISAKKSLFNFLTRKKDKKTNGEKVC
jgi:hypothetical protein